jgi:ribosomal protein S18 acetylase RimI-like enzyme
MSSTPIRAIAAPDSTPAAIRPATPEDAPRLAELTAATGLFRPGEIDTLRNLLDFYFDEGPEDHCCFARESGGRIDGYIYLGAAEEETDGTWYVWWIAVAASAQGRGAGRELLTFGEQEARRRGARVLFAETSGMASYEGTRRFYQRAGYEREAVLRDYYRDGDDMVVFRKRLAPGGPRA